MLSADTMLPQRIHSVDALVRLGQQSLQNMLEARELPADGDVLTLAKRLHETMATDAMDLEEDCEAFSQPSTTTLSPSATATLSPSAFAGVSPSGTTDSQLGRKQRSRLPARPRCPPPASIVRATEEPSRTPRPHFHEDYANYEGARDAAVCASPTVFGAGAGIDETIQVPGAPLLSRPLPVGTDGALVSARIPSESVVIQPGRPDLTDTSSTLPEEGPPTRRVLPVGSYLPSVCEDDILSEGSEMFELRRPKKSVAFLVPDTPEYRPPAGPIECIGSAGLVVHDQAHEVESMHAGETTGRASVIYRNEGGKRRSILRQIRLSTTSVSSRRSSLSVMACRRSSTMAINGRGRRMTNPICADSDSEDEDGVGNVIAGPLTISRLEALVACMDLMEPNQLSKRQVEKLHQVVASGLRLLGKQAGSTASTIGAPTAEQDGGREHSYPSQAPATANEFSAAPIVTQPLGSAEGAPSRTLLATADDLPTGDAAAAVGALVETAPTLPSRGTAGMATVAVAPTAMADTAPMLPRAALLHTLAADTPDETPRPRIVGTVRTTEVDMEELPPYSTPRKAATGSKESAESRLGRIAMLRTPSPKRQLAASIGEAPEHFKRFTTAATIEEIEDSFASLVDCSQMHARACQRPEPTSSEQHPYVHLRLLPGLPWKAAKVWDLLDAQVGRADYSSRRLSGRRVVVVGAGPVGLRLALEARLAGATVTVLEKRGEFNRINRLHLWDWVKQDLVLWGAKLFSPPGGSFGADKDYCHIGTSELQLLLLKCSLLLGVSVEMGVEFRAASQGEQGWLAETEPPLEGDQALADAVICCDGAASKCALAHGSVPIKAGLGREGKAIGIVANFTNSHTQEERDLRQFSWARQFNAQLFSDLKAKLGVDLENIVYYKGDSNHYLIMTPSKQCLVELGCLKSPDPPEAGLPLLHWSNVDLGELRDLARHVAEYFGLPTTFTPEQSVSFFDFSDTRRHEQAIIFKQDENLQSLPVCLAGDALLEPFWPTGLGCIRGFLSALDCVSSLQLWFSTYDQELVGRHSEQAYKLLKSVEAQTKDKTLRPDKEWRVDPGTRYRGFRPVADCWRKRMNVEDKFGGSLPPTAFSPQASAEDLGTPPQGCASDNLAGWRRHKTQALVDGANALAGLS